MANQGAAVEAGQCIRVSWPVAETTGEGHTVSKRKAEVLAVEKSKKVKHGSCWKYTLRFSDDNAIEKTRLTHLKFKKIESLQRSGDGDEKPKKKSKKDDSTKTASGSKKSSASASSTPSIADLQSTVMKRPGKCDWIIPPHKYICAPMVGASELAFRLLCRRYGCPMAYTPMISSTRFAQDEEYRKGEFQTNAQDRPLVAHFSANDPAHLLASAKLVEKHCDAIDLNLGCPQRVAFVGHYGSFLLDQKDRPLVL
jgi:tRNA-dihydrouridine synthase 1